MAATKKAQRVVVFTSRGANFRVVTKTSGTHFDANNRAHQEPEEALEFGPHGRLELREEDDADAIAYLRSLTSFNQEFFELGSEPDAQLPTVDEQLQQIMRLAAGFEDGALQRLIEEEHALHNRQEVLRPANLALNEVQVKRSELEAEAAREAARTG